MGAQSFHKEEKLSKEAVVDAKKFNLGEVLAGRNYPETEVEIYLDERSGLAIQEANERLNKLAALASDGDEKYIKEHEELEAHLDELVESLKERAITLKVRGIPRKTADDILKKVVAEYPIEKDSFGREKPNAEQNEAYTRLLWQAYIVQVTPPGGEPNVPSEDDIDALLSLAPDADIEAIRQAIGKVQGASAGFEVVARSVDFLSKP